MTPEVPRKRSAKSVLTGGQRRLLRVLLVLAAAVLANSAFLFFTTPAEPAAAAAPGPYDGSAWGRVGLGELVGPAADTQVPAFYQTMLLLHLLLGGLGVAISVGFVAWHLTNALARKNRRGVLLGALVAGATVLLAASGGFILTEASSVQNRWIFRTHQILAVLLPLLYLGHRAVSFVPPTRTARRSGVLGIVGATLVLLGVHAATAPEKPLVTTAAIAPAPTSTADPFIPFVPNNLGPPDSRFGPSAAGTVTGDYITRLTLTQDDLAPPEVMKADLEKYGFLVNGSMGAATCERCHAATVAQWQRSAHRFSSFNNPLYKAAVDRLRMGTDGDDGKHRSQWCGGCHDPNLMFAGKMLGDISPEWPESQAGLTCLACHAIDRIHGKAGNGNYELTDNAPDPYLFASAKSGPGRLLHDMLVKSKPAVHKGQMLKPFFRQPEFCLTCHKVSIDTPINRYRWIRGQNEYDNWQDSGVARNAARTFYLPDNRRICQDCHMPYEAATEGDVSAKNGMVRSHRFIAANTALPFIRGDADTVKRTEEFLRQEKLRIEVFAVRPLAPADRHASGLAPYGPTRGASGALADPVPGEPLAALDKTHPALVPGAPVELDVVVRNKGVGHTFPGGTNDSNEGWVELTVADAQGRVLARSGALDATGRLDPEAHAYKVLFVDEHGTPALHRDPQNFHAVVFAHVIGPGTADLVRYTFTPPAGVAGPLQVTARLLWRKFNRPYTEFVFEKAAQGVPTLPVTEIARNEVDLAVAGASGPAAAPLTAEDWMRFNDYGIASWLAQDNRTANWAFQRVRDLAPERIDGPRNLARVAITEGRLAEAYTLLDACEKLAPGDARTAWFWGQARAKEGKYTEAAQAYARVLAYFPEDRASERELGRVLYLAGRYEESLAAMLATLAVDPEDRVAHYYRMLAYQALGRKDEAAAAAQAYEKYKLDESQPEATEPYRQGHPLDNRESQSIHYHTLSAAL